MMLAAYGSHRVILHRVIDKATRRWSDERAVELALHSLALALGHRGAPHRSDRGARDGAPMLTSIAGGAP